MHRGCRAEAHPVNSRGASRKLMNPPPVQFPRTTCAVSHVASASLAHGRQSLQSASQERPTLSPNKTKPVRGHHEEAQDLPTQIKVDDLPTGIADIRGLPDDRFLELWDSIIVDPAIKSRLLNHAVLSFTLRPRVSAAAMPLHGVILLTGAPGTGKTSLARGLAARTAQIVQDIGAFRYLEVDPHALA